MWRSHMFRPKVQKVYRKFRKSLMRGQGCASELSHIPTLVAVDMPNLQILATVRELLVAGERDEEWEFEEGSVWD